MAQPMQEDFFDEPKEWSKRKHLLLVKYIAAASKIMGRIKQVYYVDGFAGEGIYGDGSKGSPVRAAELALSYQQGAKPYTLKCINVEEDEKRFANLQSATSTFDNLVLNLQGTFVDNVDKILWEVGSQAVICFLDPFGIKGIDWVAVEKIIDHSRVAPTDLWIRFDTQIKSRLHGFFDSKSSGADRKFGILPKVFGIEDKERLYNLLDGSNAEERLLNTLNLYEKTLVEGFLKARGTGFAASYPIKSLQGQCKYYLVFATANQKGATLASEVIAGIEETYQRELQEYRRLQEYKKQQVQQLELFAVDPTEAEIFQEKVDLLQQDIWKACKGKKLQRIDIYISIWEKWFGKIKGTHMNVALKELKDNGYILEVSGAISDDKTRFRFRN